MAGTSQVVMGHEGRIKRSTDGGNTYSESLGEVRTITFTEGQNFANVTNRDTSVDSNGKMWLEEKPTTATCQIDIGMNYLEDNDSVDALYDAYETNTPIYFEIVAKVSAGKRRWRGPFYVVPGSLVMDGEREVPVTFQLRNAGAPERDTQ